MVTHPYNCNLQILSSILCFNLRLAGHFFSTPTVSLPSCMRVSLHLFLPQPWEWSPRVLGHGVNDLDELFPAPAGLWSGVGPLRQIRCHLCQRLEAEGELHAHTQCLYALLAFRRLLLLQCGFRCCCIAEPVMMCVLILIHYRWTLDSACGRSKDGHSIAAPLA